MLHSVFFQTSANSNYYDIVMKKLRLFQCLMLSQAVGSSSVFPTGL